MKLDSLPFNLQAMISRCGVNLSFRSFFERRSNAPIQIQFPSCEPTQFYASRIQPRAPHRQLRDRKEKKGEEKEGRNKIGDDVEPSNAVGSGFIIL